MAIQVTCSQCGKTHNVPEKHAGKTGKCTCGAALHVPEAVEPGSLADPGYLGGGLAESTPAGATAEKIEGGIECRACGMTSRPGDSCQWCGQSLAPPRAETPVGPPGMYHAPEYTGRGPGAPPPAVVTVVRVLLMIAVVLTALAIPVIFLGGAAVMSRNSLGGSAMLVVGSVAVFFCGLYLWLWGAIGKASTAAWWVSTVLWGIYLLLSPFRLLASVSAARGMASAAATLPPDVQNSPEAAQMMAGMQAGMKAGANIGIGINVIILIIVLVIFVLWLKRDVKRWFGVV